MSLGRLKRSLAACYEADEAFPGTEISRSCSKNAMVWDHRSLKVKWSYNKRSWSTLLGRNLDFLSNPSFLANDFLSFSICGVQVSFSSTVIPSNCDVDTHSIVEFPMKIGGILTGGLLPEISIASLLLGWGVSLLMRHHSINSRTAVFIWAIIFSAVSLIQ